MVTKFKFKDKVIILFYEDSTKVTNSYLLTDREIEQVANYIEFCRKSLYDWRCFHFRNSKSYKYEIKAHNLLYKLGLFKSHTIDTDLDELMCTFWEIVYFILGR